MLLIKKTIEIHTTPDSDLWPESELDSMLDDLSEQIKDKLPILLAALKRGLEDDIRIEVS